MADIKLSVLGAKPIKANAIVFKPYPNANGILLLNRETSQPEIGNPSKEPMGKASKAEPSSASLKLKVLLIVGILEAQVAKVKPEIKKKRLKKIRCLFFVIINGNGLCKGNF